MIDYSCTGYFTWDLTQCLVQWHLFFHLSDVNSYPDTLCYLFAFFLFLILAITYLGPQYQFAVFLIPQQKLFIAHWYIILHFLTPDFISFLSLQSLTTSFLPVVLILLPTSDASQLDVNRLYWQTFPCCAALERLLESSCGLHSSLASWKSHCRDCMSLLTAQLLQSWASSQLLDTQHLELATYHAVNSGFFWHFHLQNGFMFLKGNDYVQGSHLSIFLMINTDKGKSLSFLAMCLFWVFPFILSDPVGPQHLSMRLSFQYR